VKVYPQELKIYQHVWRYTDKQALPLSNDQLLQFNYRAKVVRDWAQNHPQWHSFLQALPFIILSSAWALMLAAAVAAVVWLKLPAFLSAVILGLCHGLWGYQWVIYGMHEGAGHGLFQNSWARFLAFNSSRLLFADPKHYRIVHLTHHRALGTEEDGAFTHFVMPKRVIRSMLPGAGILFGNDYQIHQNPQYTFSRGLSDATGAAFLFLQMALLSPVIPWYFTLLALGLISPWVGMVLDRMRETLEHYLMAPTRSLGAKELGLGFWGLLIGGGPWGQPCHLTHHMAADLKWYQQIWLHFSWGDILTRQQKLYLAPIDGSWVKQFFQQMKDSKKIANILGEHV
jgi:fatty acid desaturase